MRFVQFFKTEANSYEEKKVHNETSEDFTQPSSFLKQGTVELDFNELPGTSKNCSL